MKEVQAQLHIPLVLKAYEDLNNFKVIKFDSSTSNQCIIYFSSNGLYYSNNEEEIYKKIFAEDKYEWKRNIHPGVKKAIFLRDVKKQWYLEGINKNINSIDKLSNFLLGETHGLQVTCVGISAGGYAATLIGCLLKATKIFSFSGQFSLMPYLKDAQLRLENPTVVKAEFAQDLKQYLSLDEFIEGSNTPIFYFFPGLCQQDIVQSKYVNDRPNIYKFRFKSKNHGATCYELNFMDLFQVKHESLERLSYLFKGKMISQLIFSIRISGYKKTLNWLYWKRFNGDVLKALKTKCFKHFKVAEKPTV